MCRIQYISVWGVLVVSFLSNLFRETIGVECSFISPCLCLFVSVCIYIVSACCVCLSLPFLSFFYLYLLGSHTPPFFLTPHLSPP